MRSGSRSGRQPRTMVGFALQGDSLTSRDSAHSSRAFVGAATRGLRLLARQSYLYIWRGGRWHMCLRPASGFGRRFLVDPGVRLLLIRAINGSVNGARSGCANTPAHACDHVLTFVSMCFLLPHAAPSGRRFRHRRRVRQLGRRRRRGIFGTITATSHVTEPSASRGRTEDEPRTSRTRARAEHSASRAAASTRVPSQRAHTASASASRERRECVHAAWRDERRAVW